LDDNINLKEIILGTQDTEKHIKTLFDERPEIFKSIFTPQNSYQKTESKYSNKKSIRRIPLTREARLLKGVDMSEKEKLINKEKELSVDIEQYQESIEELKKR
jgi:hypothetical protein